MVCDLDDEECCCPFAWTEASDIVQNYGCLPTPHEILYMRLVHDKTWACHSDPSKPCIGAIRALAANGLPYKVVDSQLVTEKSNWAEFLGTAEEVYQVGKDVDLSTYDVTEHVSVILTQPTDGLVGELVVHVTDEHDVNITVDAVRAMTGKDTIVNLGQPVDETTVTRVMKHDGFRYKARVSVSEDRNTIISIEKTQVIEQ